tara:strand:- start:235 stop:402 length:168 start_codon:yes stop_codon:yes gene_type:complete
MASIEIDISQRIDRFQRGQLKKDWLDIIIDDEGENSNEKHSKIKELIDSYWKHIL